ncbi:hypothetical protein T552_02162 [Pneumocystis carinii B80]|uniref:Homologous-pairing protein 2 winged helix domain-containing protein n=1 Tax=Pneumocystis carinii (strain B80) TaxID=1408658 RepID=A0A0W4ZH78_PNEC8|nr:hypothetical protein T552_02162 [Pneumocystis carinii B80]KTW27722.1 hypothetical protein T552_02162 [Pneumocystis carinii B80]
MVKSKTQSNKRDDEALVLDYLRKTNRPYSATDICLNLHNAVSKTALAKILTTLSERGDIRCKTYGKQSVYVIDQEQFENPSSEELSVMDARIEELRKQITETQEKNKQMKQALQSLLVQKTTAELQSLSKDLDQRISTLNTRLNSLQSGTARLISSEEKDAIQKNYENMRKLWKDRKTLFSNLWDAISEGESSPTELKAFNHIQSYLIIFKNNILLGTFRH